MNWLFLVTGLLAIVEGYFVIDSFRLAGWLARLVGRKRVHDYFQAGCVPCKRGLPYRVMWNMGIFLLLAVCLVTTIATVLSPLFAYTWWLAQLQISPEIRNSISKTLGLVFASGCFVRALVMPKTSSLGSFVWRLLRGRF